MPSPKCKSVQIELAIHTRLIREAGRRKKSVVAFASELFHKALPEYENEELAQRELLPKEPLVGSKFQKEHNGICRTENSMNFDENLGYDPTID